MTDIYWAARHRVHWWLNRQVHESDCLCKGSGRVLVEMKRWTRA